MPRMAGSLIKPSHITGTHLKTGSFFFLFFFFPSFGPEHSMWESWFPDQGWNPRLWDWQSGVLTPGLPGTLAHLVAFEEGPWEAGD